LGRRSVRHVKRKGPDALDKGKNSTNLLGERVRVEAPTVGGRHVATILGGKHHSGSRGPGP